MKAINLLLRCYAEQTNNQWSIVCIDLSIAAQADTFEEAKVKLDSMVKDYVYDALVGKDRKYADVLLSRKAPFSQWLKYYWIKSQIKAGILKDDLAKIFKEPLPMMPCH